MEKNRQIQSLRETPYRVHIDKRLPDEDLTVNIYGMDGDLIGTYFFDASQLTGKDSIHFRYIEGRIIWANGINPNSKSKLNVNNINSHIHERTQRDEEYVIDLCDEILGHKAKRQHRFPFLLGDSGTSLPVDAYYEDLNLVVEYCERQHTEAVPFFDRRLTVSGVGRGEQRRIYDERRREILPKHGIRLISIAYSDFMYDSRKRIVREHQRDIQIIKKILGA